MKASVVDCSLDGSKVKLSTSNTAQRTCCMLISSTLKVPPLSITFVYGQPDHTKRNEVRVELKHLQTKAQPNWLCIGDFNQVLSNGDKLSFTNNKIVGVPTNVKWSSSL